MSKKRKLVEAVGATIANPDAEENAKIELDRDLVTFYARLTHSLEKVYGRDILAQRLERLRKNPPDRILGPAEVNALSRLFRRLGGSRTSLQEFPLFVEQFSRSVALAVTRPEYQVAYMLALFTSGDDSLEVKPICGATPVCNACQLTRECDTFNQPRRPAAAVYPPAERLLTNNEVALSDAELLGVFLFGERGTGREEVVEILLARYGTLRAIFRAEAHEFTAIREMTRTLVIRLAACAAIHRRLLMERRNELLRITCAKDIHDRYEPELRDYRNEAAVLLMLDHQNQVIRDAWFCEHSPKIVNLPLADLLRPAIREAAAKLALVHNHPSNNPEPSAADVEYTRRLANACRNLDLVLVDHVIISEAKYFSFSEEGMLNIPCP